VTVPARPFFGSLSQASIVTACACVVSSSSVFASESNKAFFPDRPRAVKMMSATGVIEDFGIGNSLGGMTLKTGPTTTVYYVGANLKLNGRAVTCDHPPQAGRPKSLFCEAWPENVRLRTSHVRVTFWQQMRPGFGRVNVTDQIQSIP